jgi:tetratricopeptide (TPR) repeat protein
MLGELRWLEGRAHAWRAEFAEAQRCSSEALTLLTRGSASWYGAATDLIYACSRRSERARVLELMREVLDAGVEAGAEESRLIAWSVSACELLMSGQNDLAEEVLAALDRELPELGERGPLIIGWVQRAYLFRAYFVRGDLGASLVAGAASTASFERAGNLRAACVDRSNVGYFSIELGAYVDAERDLRQVLVDSQRMGIVNAVAVAKQNLGLALAGQGRLDEASQVEREATVAFLEHGDVRQACLSRINMARILTMARRYPEAVEEARAAVTAAEASTANRAYALAALAEARRGAGDAAGALESATEAVGLLGEAGSTEEGTCLVWLIHAETLRDSGDEAGAKTAIAAAHARVVERAAKITDPKLRDSFLKRVPDNARTMELASKWSS